MNQILFSLSCSLFIITAGCSSPGDSGGGAPSDAAGGSPSQVTTPLSPSSGSGGMVVSCAPNDGEPVTASTPFPACSFVDAQACQADADCGCGCSCQCGVCNCDATAPPGACQADADCGPSCAGLQCTSGQCVAKQASSWTGIFQGTFSWPSTVYEATCGSGIPATSISTGTTGGRFTVQVVAQDSQLEVLLLSQQASGQPLCQLPFIPDGDQAKLVAGSACVTVGLPALCSTGPVISPAAIQTFLSGSAALDGDTLTLQLADVFVAPTEPGPECDTPPPGQNQVNQETMTATLQRCPATGCPEPI